MRKKILSVMLTICMVLALMPQMVFAEGGVPYLDATGAQKTCDNATVVTSEDTTWGDDGNNGWYVVQGNVTIGTSRNPQRVTVNGNVHLILADGCNLTVNGGIQVEGTNSLTIYGQKDGTGKLYSSSMDSPNINMNIDAGIGGNGDRNGNGGSGGTIIINGGVVNASGLTGAGIGGGYGSNENNSGGNGGTIIINGGVVNATSYQGAGIGGGKGNNYATGGNGGTVTITGGMVTATCTNYGSAGIGGGYGVGGSGSGGEVTITGGMVTATSTSGAGIGGGSGGGNGTFQTNNNGNAVIFANSISDQSGKEANAANPWSGVIFVGNEGKVYGSSVTPSESFEIPADKTLTIESGKSLTIPAGKTLTNNGKIYVDGTFTGTADNLYYPLTLVDATANENTTAYNNNTYGKKDSIITLTPDTKTGYVLTQWNVSPANAITIDTNNKFIMPNKALTVAAQYKDNQKPVISGVENGKTYCSAQNVTVSDNDVIEKVTVNGTEVTLDEHKQFTLSPATGTQEIIATDKAGNSKTVTVTVNVGHTAGNDDNNCSTPVYCIYHPDTVVVAAKSHDFSGDWNKDATDHWYICQNEGCTVTDTPVPHSGGSATCTAKAKCEYCNEEYGNRDNSNHYLVNTPAKAPTYYEAGHKEYWQCTNCQKYFSDADGKSEIADIDAWKAGDGKIDRLIPPKTDSVTSDRDGNVSVSIEKSIITTDGKTEASITDAVAESILDKLESSESKSVVINVSTGSTSSGPGVAAPGTSIQISLPESAVKNLAEVEDIRITIETDNGSIVLDKRTLEAIASKSGENGTVTLVIETVEQTGSILKLELKLNASSGDVTDFGGGIAAVTVAISDELKGRNPVCVYIDEQRIYHMIGGKLNDDGTFTFETGHFSTYAIMPEEEATEVIKEQTADAQKAAIKKVKPSVSLTTKKIKKGIKVTVKVPASQKADKTGVIIYRSQKKSSGYVEYKRVKTSGSSYTVTNTKNLKGKRLVKGKKYYYKARAYKVIDGKTYYGPMSSIKYAKAR